MIQLNFYFNPFSKATYINSTSLNLNYWYSHQFWILLLVPCLIGWIHLSKGSTRHNIYLNKDYKMFNSRMKSLLWQLLKKFKKKCKLFYLFSSNNKMNNLFFFFFKKFEFVYLTFEILFPNYSCLENSVYLTC